MSWHVQNFIVIGEAYFEPEHSKFLSHFDFDRNTGSGMGARSGHVAWHDLIFSWSSIKKYGSCWVHLLYLCVLALHPYFLSPAGYHGDTIGAVQKQCNSTGNALEWCLVFHQLINRVLLYLVWNHWWQVFLFFFFFNYKAQISCIGIPIIK